VATNRTTPQPIEVTDPEGRWAIYVPLTINGKIVVPRQTDERADGRAQSR
jgi:hypothetical protein